MATAPQADLKSLTRVQHSGIVAVPTSSLPSTEVRIVPRRRKQRGRVYKRGDKWCGSYREWETETTTGKRTRRTITFPDSVTSERAAWAALQPDLDRVNNLAACSELPKPKRTGKTLTELVEEWKSVKT